MPTVAAEGRFRSVINPRENLFGPPHVHVRVNNVPACRIELNGGTFMDQPPPGEYREILNVYRIQMVAIREAWDRIHGRER